MALLALELNDACLVLARGAGQGEWLADSEGYALLEGYDVVITDGFGQQLDSVDALLTVNGRPTAAASGGATICSGSNGTPLTDSGGVSCLWSPSAGLSNASSCTPTASCSAVPSRKSTDPDP